MKIGYCVRYGRMNIYRKREREKQGVNQLIDYNLHCRTPIMNKNHRIDNPAIRKIIKELR